MCDDKIKSDNEVDVDIKGNRFEEKKEPEIVKRKIKDSVFTNLFKDKKYNYIKHYTQKIPLLQKQI